MSRETFLFIAQLQGYFALLAFSIAVLKWKRKPGYIKLIGVYAGGSAFGVILQNSMFLVFHITRGNNIIGNFYTLFEVVTLLPIFALSATSQHSRRNILILVSLFFITWLVDSFYHGMLGINSFSRTIGSIILIGAAIFYFYTLLRDLPAQRLSEFPMFWFVTAILVYNAGGFILFVFMDYLINVLKSDLMFYWSFHNVLRVIFFFLLIMSVWQDLRNRRQS